MKTSLVKAFRYCLVPSLRLGMLVIEAPPQYLRQSRQDQHFQPEAGNEVLKEFQLKLTPMRPVALSASHTEYTTEF
ncbi:MAG: hypothetical protein V7L27_22255 [Nostoc sp.]|uniref:hypothetical protein n=1 Tax=Nostoc sp. TaxID=1180 RepID=UPI002FF62BE8